MTKDLVKCVFILNNNILYNGFEIYDDEKFKIIIQDGTHK